MAPAGGIRAPPGTCSSYKSKWQITCQSDQQCPLQVFTFQYFSAFIDVNLKLIVIKVIESFNFIFEVIETLISFVKYKIPAFCAGTFSFMPLLKIKVQGEQFNVCFENSKKV